jgi:putative addiction module component (TIGR02574 family)
MKNAILEEIESLSVSEKLRLVEDIWDSLRGQLEDAEVPQEHRRILEARQSVQPESRQSTDWPSTLKELKRNL